MSGISSGLRVQTMLFLLLIGFSVLPDQCLKSQTTLVISGATNGTPTLFIKSGIHLTVKGGIRIEAGTDSSGTVSDYLQNNGTIHILEDQQSGQSDFINDINGLITYSAGETTGKIAFEAVSETQSVTGIGTSTFMNMSSADLLSPVVDLQQSVIVDGLLNIGGSTAKLNSTTLTLNGTFAGPGSLSGTLNSDLIINGSGNLGDALAFESGSQQLQTLTINRTDVGGHLVLLGSSLIISDSLTLTDGVLNIQNNDLSLASSATLLGSPFSLANMIQADANGQFILGISAGSGSYYFPIGDGTPAFSPVTLNFGSNETAGNVGVLVKPAVQPNMDDPIPASDYLRRYWTFSNSGLTNYSYSGTFEYLNSEVEGTESEMKLSRWANAWNEVATSSAASNNLTMNVSVTETQTPLTGDFTGRKEACFAEAGALNSFSEINCTETPLNLSTTGLSGSLQWQSSPNGVDFTVIDNATDSTYQGLINEPTYFRVIDGTGSCTDTSNVLFIAPDSLPLASFSYLQGNGYLVDFSNLSSANSTSLWNFGNNSTSTEQNPSHVFPFDGTYPVTLISSSNCGSDTFIVDVVVFKLGLNELSDTYLEIWPNPFNNHIQLKLNTDKPGTRDLTIYDAVGRPVSFHAPKIQEGQIYTINLTEQPAGIYYVRLIDNLHTINRKLIKSN
jgi:PKD repeat protein